MERSFGAMLRQLPGKTEVPNLLVDISQTGLAAGPAGKAVSARRRKEQRLLRGAADQDQAGGQLPSVRRFRERHRRVAAHRHAARHPDHAGRRTKNGGYDNLTMDVTAKTYRYIEDEGGGKPAAAAKKKTGGAT